MIWSYQYWKPLGMEAYIPLIPLKGFVSAGWRQHFCAVLTMLEYVGLENLFLNSLNNTIDLVCMQFLKLYPILLFPPERVKNNSLNEVYQYIW
jgi:hypothetical protein